MSEIKFVKKMLGDFTVSINHTRVAIVTFSSQGKVVSFTKDLGFHSESFLSFVKLYKLQNAPLQLSQSSATKMFNVDESSTSYSFGIECTEIISGKRFG